MTNPINTSGGTYIDGNANVGNDFIGRDKNIYYISLVGHLLDWVQPEGLFPKIEEKQDFSSIAEAVEGTLNTRPNTDLADAVAFAGEVIGDFFIENKDIKVSPVPLEEILYSLINIVGEKLVDMDYWEAHSELSPSFSVLRLYATEALFKKYSSKPVKFALLGSPPAYHFFGFGLGIDGELYIQPQLKKRFTHKQLRLIVTGIVLDLIRIKSEEKVSYQFLQDMANLFNRGK